MSDPTITLHNDLIAHDAKAICTCISPHSGQLIGTGGEDNALHVWRLGRPTALLTLRDFKRPVTTLSFSFQEKHLACGTDGGGVRVVSLVNGAIAASFPAAHTSGVTCVAWHPRGERFLATGGKDCRVQLLDAANSVVVNTFTVEKAGRTCPPPPGSATQPAPITALAFSPPGTWLATGDASGRVTVWDLKEGKPLGMWEGVHRAAVTSLLWHPTELMLASAGLDKCIKWWSLEGRRAGEVARPGEAVGLFLSSPPDTGPIRSLALTSPRGELLLASVTHEHLRLWKLPRDTSDGGPGITTPYNPQSPRNRMPPSSLQCVDVIGGAWGGEVGLPQAVWVGNAARSRGGAGGGWGGGGRS